MKKIYFIIIVLFLSVKTFALTGSQIDSMWRVINDYKQPIKERVYALYRLHFEYDDENPEKALSLATIVIAESNKKNYAPGAGVAEIILGNAITYKYSKDSAAIHRDRAIEAFLNNSVDGFYLAYAYMYKAESLADRGFRDSAMVLYDKAIDICFQQQDYLSATDILIHYAADCRRGANFQKASSLLSKAISLAEKNNYKEYIAAIHIEMADIFKLGGNNSKYEEYILMAYTETLKNNGGIKLARNLSRMSAYFQEKNDETICLYIGHVYDSLSLIDLNANITNMRNGYWTKYYLAKGNPEKALAFAKKSLDMSRKNNWGTGLSGHYISVGRCLVDMKEYETAQSYFDSAYMLAAKYKYQTIILDVFKNKANAYRMANDFENSNIYLTHYIEQNKMMTEDENKKKIAEMQALYDVEKRNNQIAILNKENKLRSKERNIFIGLAFMVAVALAAITIAFINKRKANKLLTQQKQEIIDKTEMLNQQAAQIAKLQTQMNPHFIFNAINSVQRFVLKEDKNTALDYLNDFARLMRKMLNNSDKELISLKEEKDFLIYYLKFELLRYENQFSYEIIIDENLDEEIVEIPPMLIQPYIENAIKHGLISKEGKGLLSLKFELHKNDIQEYLKIIIADDGIGRIAAANLKTGSVLTHESKGMDITANRIFEINKKYKNVVENAVQITDLHNDGTGTKVSIFLPYIENF